MGNRAVITTPDKKMGVYLHWNGGRDSVEPYRVCGFAVPPSLRRTGERLPFVEMHNAEEGREAVLLNPNNFIRSATVRVTR